MQESNSATSVTRILRLTIMCLEGQHSQASYILTQLSVSTVHQPNRPGRDVYHEPGERRKHIDGRVDLSVVELTVHVHLALSDVACQVRNRVGDVIIRHGEDGQLRDGALAPLNTPCPLIDGGQVSVHISCTTNTDCHDS